MENKEYNKAYNITALIRRKIQGQQLSPQEERDLAEWCNESVENSSFYEKMQDEGQLARSVNRYLATDTQGRWEEFRLQHLQRRGRTRKFRVSWYAAAVLLIIGISLVLYVYQHKDAASTGATTRLAQQDSLPMPGGNRAILTWADGSSVELSENHTGLLVGEELVYEDGSVLSQAKTRHATLTTPKGGQYRITLPDGTKVWLNAASSLQYPTQFDGSERKVRLTGEAYFDVAHKEDQPFVVETAQQSLKVLGTVFNINAYAEEGKTSTTLLEGKVAVRSNNLQGTKSATLAPGQQSILEVTGLRVAPVDVQEAIAWREGKFVFSNSDIHSVMRQIARWYDVEIVYEGDLSAVLFTGSMSRFADIHTVVQNLELTREIELNIQGRRIVVKKR